MMRKSPEIFEKPAEIGPSRTAADAVTIGTSSPVVPDTPGERARNVWPENFFQEN
jgi:hypothetical protein